MKSLLVIIFLISFTLFTSCSKKVKSVDLIIKTSELYHLAEAAKFTVNNKPEDAIKFSEYSMGVNPYTSKVYEYQSLIFYAIEFPNEESAKAEAKRLDQYYSKNWLFDRVSSEPVLVDLIKKVFQAKND